MSDKLYIMDDDTHLANGKVGKKTGKCDKEGKHLRVGSIVQLHRPDGSKVDELSFVAEDCEGIFIMGIKVSSMKLTPSDGWSWKRVKSAKKVEEGYNIRGFTFKRKGK